MHSFSGTAAAALLLAAALAPSSSAQEAAQVILREPEAIRACLCRHQAVTALATEVDQAKQTYDAQQQELQVLERQINEARQRLDVASLAERNSFAHLLGQRDAANDRFAGREVPQYNALVQRYDAQATAFNRDCAGKGYDPQALSLVQANLACPPELVRPEP